MTPLPPDECDRWRSTWRETLRQSGPASGCSEEAYQLTKLRVLAKSANGLELTPDESLHHDHWKHQETANRRLEQAIRAETTGCEVLKGTALADLYPDGWVRTSGDLDLTVRTMDDLWGAGAIFLSDGWDLLSSTTAATGHGDPVVGLVFSRPCGGCGRPLWADVQNVAFLGDPWTIQVGHHPLLTGAAFEVRQLVAILGEAFERPFSPRDVLDVQLLATSVDDDLASAWPVLDEIGLWPEYRQLCAVASTVGTVLPEPDDLARRAAAVDADRSRRHRMLLRNRTPWAFRCGVALRKVRNDRLQLLGSRLVRRLAPADAIYTAGLPVSGLQVDDAPGPYAVEPDGSQLRMTSPLGTFFFSPTPDLVVPEEEGGDHA